MRVDELMTKGVQTVSATTSAEQAWTLMRAKGIHHLVVLEGREVAGVLSSGDLGGRRGARVRANSTVGDCMTAPAVCVAPDTTVRRAANMMRGRAVGSLVVTSGARPIGIITTADLLDLLGRGADRGAATTTRWTLKHRAPHRKRHLATGVW